MDKLCISLNDTALGGHAGGQLLNHLCYADHMSGTMSYSLVFKPIVIKFEKTGFYIFLL